jgi:glycosyltransferase involved in cell wall biosynthesis
VTFTGYLSGQPLMSHLSALSIGVIPDPPNEFNDKLSMNKVFEYMLLGLPFLQFDLAQAASEAGMAATVVKEHSPEALAREIVRLADDPERRQAMSAFGLQTAQREFQWSVAQASYLAAYQAVLRQEPVSHDQRNRAAPRSGGSAEPMPGIPALSGKGDGIA